MIGANVVVKEGAFIHRAVVHNRVFVGQGTTLRGCVVGKNTDVMRRARIEETAVIGDECVIEPEAYISAGVKVYPFKTIEAGAVVNTSVVWESRGQRTLFGQRGVSGLINVEVTPELCRPAGLRVRDHAARRGRQSPRPATYPAPPAPSSGPCRARSTLARST